MQSSTINWATWNNEYPDGEVNVAGTNLPPMAWYHCGTNSERQDARQRANTQPTEFFCASPWNDPAKPYRNRSAREQATPIKGYRWYGIFPTERQVVITNKSWPEAEEGREKPFRCGWCGKKCWTRHWLRDADCYCSGACYDLAKHMAAKATCAQCGKLCQHARAAYGGVAFCSTECWNKSTLPPRTSGTATELSVKPSPEPVLGKAHFAPDIPMPTYGGTADVWGKAINDSFSLHVTINEKEMAEACKRGVLRVMADTPTGPKVINVDKDTKLASLKILKEYDVGNNQTEAKVFDFNEEGDDVGHQSHYEDRDPEPIDVIEGWNLPHHLASVVSYIARAGHKPGEPAAKDLRKALWYLTRYIDNLEAS